MITMILVAPACSSIAETTVEQIAEADDGIADVTINDGEITIDFEDSEGGGSLVIGGGDVPDGLPIPVPDGGKVMTSIVQDGTYAVMLMYPVAMYDEILSYYAGWIGGQDTSAVNEMKSTNPRSDGWAGGIGEATIGVVLIEGPGESGEPVVNLLLNWEE